MIGPDFSFEIMQDDGRRERRLGWRASAHFAVNRERMVDGVRIEAPYWRVTHLPTAAAVTLLERETLRHTVEACRGAEQIVAWGRVTGRPTLQSIIGLSPFVSLADLASTLLSLAADTPG